MNIDVIYEVFKVIDADLKELLDEDELEDHLQERSIAFWSALYKINQNGIYAEFMEK